MRDLVLFQQRAERYLAYKRVPREARDDLVQEILLEVLEQPEAHLNLGLLYLHAWDRLNPRVRQAPASRLRLSQRTIALETPLTGEDGLSLADRLPAPEALAETEVPAALQLFPSLLRRDVERYYLEEWRMAQIAALDGVTASRISQRLTLAKAWGTWQGYRSAGQQDLVFDGLLLEVRWLTL